MKMKNVNEIMLQPTVPLAEEFKSTKENDSSNVNGLLFGADIKTPVDNVLQNNITQFEWIVRNKVYPVFCGRNISGENCLTKSEIKFLHKKGCRIAAIYGDELEKITVLQGEKLAKKVFDLAFELSIPLGKAIFLEIGDTEHVTTNFMEGFAKTLKYYGYTPGFKANTDAEFTFDREFSRGIQINPKIFSNCLIWAKSPSLKEYDEITTTHIIKPDKWLPFAPSGITRRDIAIWQYGKNCHPIEDHCENNTKFNINLVRNEKIINEKMF